MTKDEAIELVEDQLLQANADKVIDAIFAGATAVAGPATARALNGLGLPWTTRPQQYMQEGTLYAVDMTAYRLDSGIGKGRFA